MQLNSDEEIRQILLNDLKGAGQTQIGQTMTTTGIPNDPAATTPPASPANPLKYNTYSPGVSLNDFNASHAKIQKQFDKGAGTKNYNADGSFKSSTTIQDPNATTTGGKTNFAPKTMQLPVDQAALRGAEALAQIQVIDPATGQPTTSTNPLDIKDDYQRGAYILQGEYASMRPANVSDAAHIMAVEKMLAEGTHTARQITGIPTDNRVAVAKLLSGDMLAGDVKIYDPGVQGGGPVNLSQWSAGLDDALWSTDADKAQAGNDIINALKKNAGESADDSNVEVEVRGMTMDPKHPGAYEVIVRNNLTNESKTLFVEGATNNREFFTPAARLVAVVQGNYRNVEVPVPHMPLPGNGQLYIKETVIAGKDSNGSLKYNSVINLITKDASGNIINSDEIDPSFINTVTEEAFNTFLNSDVPVSSNFRSRLDPKDAYQ